MAKAAKPGGAKPKARTPQKCTPGAFRRRKRDEGGPIEWLAPTLEASYRRLAPAGAPAASGVAVARSSLSRGTTALAQPPARVWRDVLLAYKRRKSAPSGAAFGAPAAPVVPGGRNWRPLGPDIVLNGQTKGDQPVAGRIAGIAAATGGAVVYAASANGGVFRSDDGGASWRSLMDRFDLDPTSFASASLICGAIAIDGDNSDRVWVGTGEGDTSQMFSSRIVEALPAYRGVGVIASDDGGETWKEEPSTPSLDGDAFFALAIDPSDSDRLVAATTSGLYRREASAQGASWRRMRQGVFSSVVAAAAGATRFFAAQWAVNAGETPGVFRSDDGGASWHEAAPGFPANAGRIALAVQRGNAALVYAFVAKPDGALRGLYRLDLSAAAPRWKSISELPPVLPGKQGDYDLAIAVDPANPDLVYLGGDYADVDPYPGSVWRCAIDAGALKVTSSQSIGEHAHADVHVLVHTQGDSDALWCGCDGGAFLNRNPRRNGRFAAMNNGLACLCANFIAQHPDDPGVLFTGLQDNGTAFTASGPVWTHVSGGDGGYCLVNQADPDQVLVFTNGWVLRSSTGGYSSGAWESEWEFPWATMTQPIVGPPFNAQNPQDSQRVAIAAGADVFFSDDFAVSWKGGQLTIPGGQAAGSVFALAFASADRLYAATTSGRVFRADRSTAGAWRVERLDNAPAGALGLSGLINDIAVDWSDPQRNSVYVCFGGMGDRRRVWRFDGARWRARSGSGENALLDVEHNALAIDPLNPSDIYVGADIGVWRSPDGGASWAPLQNGLPDAPVFDLQIHPNRRLLRAATHGRGLFEIALA